MKQNVYYKDLDFSNNQEIGQAAIIHESTPIIWNPNYQMTQVHIDHSIKDIKNAKDNAEVKILLAKNSLDEIIGLHWVKIDLKYGEKCGHIHSLWVAESYRKQGIAKELKKQGEAWAKSMQANFMLTEVYYKNKNMLEYNLKLGYKAGRVEMIKDL